MRGLAMPLAAGSTTFTWFGDPPIGPGIPFGSPAIALYDSLRIVCFVAGAAAIAFAVVLIGRHGSAIGQRLRMACLVGGVLYACMTEAYRFGDYANLRLVLALLVTIGSAWSCYLGLRYESPAVPNWNRRE